MAAHKSQGLGVDVSQAEEQKSDPRPIMVCRCSATIGPGVSGARTRFNAEAETRSGIDRSSAFSAVMSSAAATAAKRTAYAMNSAANLVQRFRQRELGRAHIKDIIRTSDTTHADKPTKPLPTIPNPFTGQRNLKTGRWDQPAYSRRRQAELVKAAKLSATLHLLPPGPKLRSSEIANFRVAHEKQIKLENGIPFKKSGKNWWRRRGTWSNPSVQSLCLTLSSLFLLELVRKLPQPADHERQVRWAGRVWNRQVKGAMSGSRLYARKKFMFKGHAWEKVLILRKRFIKVRLRSQSRRIKTLACCK